MNCKNCHKPIEWYNGLEGEGHWMHSGSMLQACSINTSGQWAEPENDTIKKYEYVSGYLLEDDAKDINAVTDLMNHYGEGGWHFTGHAKEVQNGTFYMFARVRRT